MRLKSQSDEENTKSNTNRSPSSGSETAFPHTSFSLDDYEISPNKVLSESIVSNYAVESIPKMNPVVKVDQTASSSLSPEEKAKERNRKILTLVVYGTAEFFSAVVISLQQPFYPAEAEKKGLSATKYGAVFGVFELTVFLSSFVYGKYMSVIGPRFAFILGLLVTGTCSILFGFLDKVEDGNTFFALSMVVRIVEALGDAAFLNAAFVIVAMEFTDSIATVFGAMETIVGVGFIIGPILGGALFQVGGFYLPFLTMGIFSILTAIFTFFVMPHPRGTNDSIKESKQKGMLKLLAIPEVFVAAISILFGAMSMGYLSATLEPHIRIFELSPVEVGLVIVITGVVYASTAPIWGMLCDKWPKMELYMLIGSVFITLGYLIIGPAPFFPFDTILWVTCVGLAVHGFGLSPMFVSACLRPLKSANEHGFPDTIATYSLVSNIWTSFFSLGNFIGPLISGILYDTVGFRNGSLFIVFTQVLIMMLILMLFIYRGVTKNGKYKNKLEEMDPLLGTSKTYGSNSSKDVY